MNTNKDLEEAITKIFGCNWASDDYDPEGEMYEYAQQVLEQCPWDEIYQCVKVYFKEHSSTLAQTLNFIDLYTGNNFIDKPVTEPYEFAALVASKVDFDQDWDNGAERVYDFLTSLLENSGEISFYVDPYYQLHKDPKFVTAMSELKNSSNNNQ